MTDISTDSTGASGPVRRAADLTRFREMIHRQTDELNSAIQQRSDYERRLETAERLAADLQDENMSLKQQLLQRGPTPPPAADAHQSHGLLSAMMDTTTAESTRRLLIHNEESQNFIDQLVTQFVSIQVEGIAERAIGEEKSRSSALTFQLRVATPMRIRGLMAKIAVAEKREAAAQKSLQEANQEIEMLLLDCGELRDKNSDLDNQVYRLQGELSAASRTRDQLEDSNGANEELMRQIESHHFEVQMLHDENEKLRQDLAAAANELALLVKRESSTAVEVSAMLKEGDDAAAALRVVHTQAVGQLEGEISTVKEELNKLRSALKLSNERAELAEQREAEAAAANASLTKRINDSDRSNAELERQLQVISKENEALRHDLTSAAGEVRELVRKESSATSDVSKLRYEGEAQANTLREAHARDVSELEGQISSMRDAQRKLEQDRRTLATREHGLSVELESFQEMISRLKSEKEEAVKSLQVEKLRSAAELQRLQETLEQRTASNLGELRGLRMAVTSADVSANNMKYQTESLRQQLEEALQRNSEAVKNFVAEKRDMENRLLAASAEHSRSISKLQDQAAETARIRERHWEDMMAAFVEESEDRVRVLVAGRQELLDAVCQNEILVLHGVKERSDLIKDAEASHRQETAALEAQYGAEIDRITITVADRERSLRALRDTVEEKDTLLARKDAVLDDMHQQISQLEAQLRDERGKRREFAAQCGEQEALLASLEKMLAVAQARALKSESSATALEEKVQHLTQVSKESGIASEERHQAELQSLIDSELALRRQKTQLQTELQRVTNEVERLSAVEDSLRHHSAANQGVLEQQHAEIVKLRSEVDILQQSRRLLEREKLTLQTELTDLQETGNSYKEVLGNASTARVTLTEELLHLREKFSSQTAQLRASEGELELTKGYLHRATVTTENQAQELALLQAQCRELKTSFDEVCLRLRESDSENATLRDIMEESIEAVETEVRALQVETTSLKHDNDELRRSGESKAAEIQRLVSFVSSLQSDSAVCESHWKDRYHAMENQCAALRSQVATMEEQAARLATDHTNEHRAWKLQGVEQTQQHERELAANVEAMSQLKQKLITLTQTLAERNEQIAALEAQLARMSTDIKMLEYASVEALEEHRAKAEEATEHSLEYWNKIESSAEQVARMAVQVEKVTRERDILQQQLDRLQEDSAVYRTHATEQLEAVTSRHQSDALAMESMMEALVAQERQQRLAAAHQLAEVEGKWHKALQHGEVESMRADAAESSLQRLKEQLTKTNVEFGEQRTVADETLTTTAAELRATQLQAVALRAHCQKLEDALELEKTSSLAEEHALREELERREKHYEKKLSDLSNEWRSELERRGVAATHLSKSHSGEVDNLQHAVKELEHKLELARLQHTELFQRFSSSQQKIDEVTHLLGASRLDCERLERAAIIKDNNLDAAISQAADAAAAAAQAHDARAAVETQAMELRRAIMAAQRDLEVAQKNEAATAQSVGSLESTIEGRWQRKLDVQREESAHFMQHQCDTAASILQRLETESRSTIEFLYQDIGLPALFTRVARMWSDSAERWVATESRLMVDLDAVTKVSRAATRQLAVTQALLQVQLQESDARGQMFLTAGDATIHADAAARCTRALLEHQRESRVHQTRSSAQDITLKKLRLEVDEHRVALQATKLELDEAKRNCDSFAKISEDMSAEAAEWKSKFQSEASLASKATSSCASALEFTTRSITEQETEWRYRFQSIALDVLADVAHAFTALFSDACRENVGLNRLKDRAEAALRAEVDTLHATWRDRLDDATLRCRTAEGRCDAMALLHSEALTRVATHQAMYMWVAQEYLPAMHQRKLAIVTTAHQREVRELRHAIYVGHKESLLIKQRAQSLVDMEVASCKQVLDRLHRRRVDDLSWLPHSAVMPPSQRTGSAKEPTPGFLVAQYLVEDLETESRAVVSRLCLDALHALHMCLLIS